MSKKGKWDTDSYEGELHNVLFVSRNKDNVDVENFKERRKAFVSTRTPEQLKADFDFFKNQGQPGETSRFYCSVNARDEKKVRKELLKWLVNDTLTDTNVSMATLPSRVAKVAALTPQAATHRWLFDYDADAEHVDEFVQDVYDAYAKQHERNNQKRLARGKEPLEMDDFYVKKHKTPNGFAVVSSSGFDTRELVHKWTSDEMKDFVKKDDLLCVMWGQQNEETVVGATETCTRK